MLGEIETGFNMVLPSFMGGVRFQFSQQNQSYDYCNIYPLVNVYIAMENHYAING